MLITLNKTATTIKKAMQYVLPEYIQYLLNASLVSYQGVMDGWLAVVITAVVES